MTDYLFYDTRECVDFQEDLIFYKVSATSVKMAYALLHVNLLQPHRSEKAPKLEDFSLMLEGDNIRAADMGGGVSGICEMPDIENVRNAFQEIEDMWAIDVRDLGLRTQLCTNDNGTRSVYFGNDEYGVDIMLTALGSFSIAYIGG